MYFVDCGRQAKGGGSRIGGIDPGCPNNLYLANYKANHRSKDNSRTAKNVNMPNM